MNWMEIMTSASASVALNHIKEAVERKAAARPKSVDVAMWAYPALTKGAPPGLQVHWDQTPIPDAHLVPVVLGNRGRKEIEAADFDGEPVVITIQGKVHSCLEKTDEKDSVNITEGVAVVRIEPTRIEPMNYVGVLLLVEGFPSMNAEVRESLRGTTVTNLTTEDANVFNDTYLSLEPFGLPSVIEYHNLPMP